MGVGERVEAARERREPGDVAFGQRAGEERPSRRRAHRRHVGKIHRERLVAELFRVRVGEEMAPADEHVDGNRELAARAMRRRSAASSPTERRTEDARAGRVKKRAISSNSFTGGL